jgi:hypothetical protein
MYATSKEQNRALIVTDDGCLTHTTRRLHIYVSGYDVNFDAMFCQI